MFKYQALQATGKRIQPENSLGEARGSTTVSILLTPVCYLSKANSWHLPLLLLWMVLASGRYSQTINDGNELVEATEVSLIEVKG